MKRQIAFTPSDSALPLTDFGRQRRQARYPACSACFGREEELNVLPPRTPRRTRRPAVHARGRDGEDEFAVVGGVARADGIPAPLVAALPRSRRLIWVEEMASSSSFPLRVWHWLSWQGKPTAKARSGLSDSCGQSEIVDDNQELTRSGAQQSACSLMSLRFAPDVPKRIRFPVSIFHTQNRGLIFMRILVWHSSAV